MRVHRTARVAARYPFAMTASAAPAERPRALIGWRLLSLLYDVWPVLALWMLISLAFTLGYTFLGHHGARENIAPYSPLQLLLWLCCWSVAGLYATLSWARGGQTLGMRPWRLKVVDMQGGPPTMRALWLRFAVATLSLVLGGLGFWWGWVDRDRLAWHDRFSGTRMIRLPKQKR
ncbi:RDD family protein [Pseudomonas sp. R2.Fl]|nr:RDD family protein [Pseudomonas sp. R2.Fl]